MATQNYFKAKNGLEAPSQSTIAVTDSNFPTVRPTLNLDFAGSESVDSRITFTRASAATYFGADGKLKYAVQNQPRIDYNPVTGECKGLLIEEQRTNLNTYTKTFSSDWVWSRGVVVQGAAKAPDGSYSAILYKEDTQNGPHYLGFTTTTSSGTYTVSAYVKAATRTYANIALEQQTAGPTYYGSQVLSIDLTTGVTQNIARDNYPTLVSSSSTYVGNGWYRIALTATLSTGAGVTSIRTMIYPANALGSASYQGDGSSGIYVWGAQTEVGSFPTSYIPSTDSFTSRASSATYFDSTGTLRIAGTNQARYGYGYDAASGKWVSQGLLLEGAATNLISYSQDVYNGLGFLNGTISANAVLAPDGTTTAAMLTQSGSDTAFTGSGGFISVTSGTAYTISYYVKAGTASSFYILFYGTYFNNNGVNPVVQFNLVTGTASAASAPITNYSITPVGSGWYRVSATCVATGTTSSAGLAQVFRFADPGTSVNAYIWGFQAEAGTSASSYIPTFGAQATRAADVSSSAATTRGSESAVINTSAFNSGWFNTQNGTLVRSMTIASDPIIGTPAAFYCTGFYDGTDANRMHIRVVRDLNSPYVDATSRTQGVAQADTGNFALPTPVPGSIVTQAMAYSTNDFCIAYNGAIHDTDTSFNVPSVDRMQILVTGETGIQAGGAAYVRRITYYPKRLSNAQLTSVTA